MTSRRRVYWMSLVTTFISGTYSAVSPFLSLLIIGRGGDYSSVKFYRELFKVLWMLVTFGIIYVWYRMGKTADMKHDYKSHIQSMGASWVVYTVLLVPMYFTITEEMWKSSIQIALTQSVFSGYSVGAMMFSALTLGWLVEERPVFRKEFNQVILRPVLIYNGVKLLQSILRDYIYHLNFTTSLSIRSMGTYNAVIGALVFPIWIWYLTRLLGAGKNIELKTDYPIIMFTLWAPNVAKRLLSEVSQILFRYFTYSATPDFLDILYDLAFMLINSVKGLMGLAFGLVCLGYLNSRYQSLDEVLHNTDSSQSE